MIAVAPHAQGSVLTVRAKPGAKTNGSLDEYNGALRVSVTAPADQGKANKAIIAVLAEALRVRRSEITLLSGQTSRDKKLLFAGIAPADLQARVDAALTPRVVPPLNPNDRSGRSSAHA